jgi:hypothetical protein
MKSGTNEQRGKGKEHGAEGREEGAGTNHQFNSFTI